MAASLTARFGIATGAYVDERDDWPAAIGRAKREGWRTIELGAMIVERLAALVELLARDLRLLDGFERVSVHAPARAGGNLASAALMLKQLPYDIVFHPDVYREQEWIRELASRAVFENMDATKQFGRDVGDLSETFAAFPDAGFCLDVAHVWTNDPTLALGHELLDAHGGRLRQLHVSGIEPDGTHRTTTQADLELYEPLLARCSAVPWLLEAELEGVAA